MIEDKAKELGRLLGQSDEYKALLRANDMLRDDKAAVTILQDMEQIRTDAQSMLQHGEQPSEEMEQQLDGLLAKIEVMPAYQRMAVAQDNFDKMMRRVNDWISDGIAKGAQSPIITLG